MVGQWMLGCVLRWAGATANGAQATFRVKQTVVLGFAHKDDEQYVLEEEVGGRA